MCNEFINNYPQGVFQKNIEILPEYAYVNGNVTPGALACIMQDITEAHMDESGLGYVTLCDLGYLWFIVWTSVWTNKLPKQGQICIVRTWPGEIKLGMYSRRYGFYTEEGEELLTASSLFMLIDEASRKMVTPDDLPHGYGVVELEGQKPLPKQRLKFPELPLAQNHTVPEHEIDKNGHVNNACYLDWAYNLMNAEYMEKHPLKFFWVQYSKELMLGQTVAIQHTFQNNEFYVKGVADGETSFMVKMDFEEA